MNPVRFAIQRKGGRSGGRAGVADQLRRKLPALSSGRSPTEAPRGMGSVLDRLAFLQRRSGIPLVLVYLEIDSARESRSEPTLERAARMRQLHYLDTRDAFRGMDPREFWIHPLDAHPNARAHAIFAREIGSFLRASGLHPRPKTADPGPHFERE